MATVPSVCADPPCCIPAGMIDVLSYSIYNGGISSRDYRDLHGDNGPYGAGSPYSLGNPAAGTYGVLCGGTGELTDGFIADQSFYQDNGVGDDFEPYVGWDLREGIFPDGAVPINIIFDDVQTVDLIYVSVDDTDNPATSGVAAPSSVDVNGVNYAFPPNPTSPPGAPQVGGRPYTAIIPLVPPVTATTLSLKFYPSTGIFTCNGFGACYPFIFISELSFSECSSSAPSSVPTCSLTKSGKAGDCGKQAKSTKMPKSTNFRK